MSERPQARFYVNNGLAASPADILHLLRPLLRQTVAYRYERGGTLVASGTSWVERLVIDRPDVSTFFTPLSICINVDSWEHLEFETRPDQLMSYVLVQGDERVLLEFAPLMREGEPDVEQQTLRLEPASAYIQMTLAALDADEHDAGDDDDGGPAAV